MTDPTDAAITGELARQHPHLFRWPSPTARVAWNSGCEDVIPIMTGQKAFP
ncbi:hypothetical protein ABT289_34030 [Streptomyces fimicarius]|uniref:hypothetical protein n=1 Tax=Streptomyces griseus TaxID=1911 RepID=UPI0033224AF9